ncbi:MAG: sigma-70 family RNA polymerase sigma factor [Bacteroidaceae bacterium]|nr:sigma-70 family RNA polymerase sigma factor [Bacteroidaceae bacterium]
MDNVSFQTTVLPLSDRLFRLALRVTMNRAEAEDVVQDTLLRVWERRSEWEQIDSLEAFAIATCRNRALDVAKRAGRNTVPLDKVEGSHLSVTGTQRALEAREQLSLVRRLMDSLPELQRTIMLLRDIEGQSYGEIAKELGISETQVKVYLHRARSKVRAGLGIMRD